MVSGISSIAAAQSPSHAGSASVQKASGFSAAFQKAVRPSGKKSLDEIFSEASEKYGVPVNLLKAVAKAESGFQADAVSCCGAQGIMQLMPSTARSLGVTNSFDPQQNIMGGAKYLGQLLHSFGGSEKLAVAAYNAGGGAVRAYGGVPPYAETQNYVKKVLGYAGDDISVPAKLFSGESGLSSDGISADSAVSFPSAQDQAGTYLADSLPFSLEDYQLFAQMLVQKLEQNIFDTAAGGFQKDKTISV